MNTHKDKGEKEKLGIHRVGRTYKIEFLGSKSSVNWDLMENQLFKLANDIERVCRIPVNIKVKDYNSSGSECQIKYGHLETPWEEQQI